MAELTRAVLNDNLGPRLGPAGYDGVAMRADADHIEAWRSGRHARRLSGRGTARNGRRRW